MSAKELKIVPPEGYEIDWKNSSTDTIRFKPIEKKITYQDVKDKLFTDNKNYYLEYAGDICSSKTIRYCSANTIMAVSKNQIEQLLALNKLMNVAKYLNGDWKPDWNDEYENKFYIYCLLGKLSICQKERANHGCAAFKSKEIANQAIEILGEEEVKKALGIFE